MELTCGCDGRQVHKHCKKRVNVTDLLIKNNHYYIFVVSGFTRSAWPACHAILPCSASINITHIYIYIYHYIFLYI